MIEATKQLIKKYRSATCKDINIHKPVVSIMLLKQSRDAPCLLCQAMSTTIPCIHNPTNYSWSCGHKCGDKDYSMMLESKTPLQAVRRMRKRADYLESLLKKYGALDQ